MTQFTPLSQTRGAGILLPISSLPTEYGIGTLGADAYEFVDMLVEAKQKYWQVLPVGPTSFGDSPYQSFSAFAGNPYFIDLNTLVSEGLLEKEEIASYEWGADPTDVDYVALFDHRFTVLKQAFMKSGHRSKKEYKNFLKENAFWIEDYSLYMALKFHFDNNEWLLWDADIRLREKETVKRYKTELAEEIDFWKFCQYKFFQQWGKLKEYANAKGVRIIGDIPLYVSMDSADVWVHGRLFELDERRKPINVAGVPPDCFSVDGQRWGNPLYDWEAMEAENFGWWEERMKSNAKLYDVIRIDHFIGIARYYSIPVTCPTARIGRWRKGPGIKLTNVIKQAVGDADIIAEDLGTVVPSVRRLINRTGWPGMKILEFGFDGNITNEHLPHNFISPNLIVYGGTHDNETIVGFFQTKDKSELKFVKKYLNVQKKKQIPAGLIRCAYASVAGTAIFQLQDILELDNRARMNLPSTVGNNWRWRMFPGQFKREHARKLRKLVETYGR